MRGYRILSILRRFLLRRRGGIGGIHVRVNRKLAPGARGEE